MFSPIRGICLNDDRQTFTVVLPSQYRIFRYEPLGLIFSKDCEEAPFGSVATFDGYRFIALTGSPSSSGFNSKTVRVFDHQTGREIFNQKFSDHVLTMKLGRDLVIVACSERIEVWKTMPRPEKLHSFMYQLNVHAPLDFAKDSANFIIPGANPQQIVINRGIGNSLRQSPVIVDEVPISLVKLSDDTSLFASTGFGGKVTRIWDFRTASCAAILDKGQSTDVQTVSFSPGNEYVATCGKDGLLKVFDIRRRVANAMKTTTSVCQLSLCQEVHTPRLMWMSSSIIVVVTLEGDMYKVEFDGSSLEKEKVSFLKRE
jgi:WD40 repeat protein